MSVLEKNKNNNKIDIVYILTKLELGGAQKVCLSLIEGLSKKNSKVALISGNQGVLLDQIKDLNNIYLLDSFKREVSLKNIFLEIKNFLKIIKILKNLKKNNKNLIVHTHSTKAGIIGRWAALFAGIKYRIHTVHGFGFHDYQNKLHWLIIYLFEFFASLITTKFICVSNYDQNIGSRLLPGFRKKSTIIHAAVDWERFYVPAKKINFFNNKIILGTVSCFKPQKNIFDLLKSFKIVTQDLKDFSQNIYLQIIGDGALRQEIEYWIFQNNLTEKIELLGWQHDVHLFVKNWDIFLLSSLWEGLPCALIEARLAKVPVVSYSVAGIPEVILNNKNGYLVAPGDFIGLAENIKKILLNKDLKEKISLYNDNLAYFKNEFMVNQHFTLYNKLIS